MRLTFTYLLILFISASCTDFGDVPGHDNFENGWEIEKLKGKVKTLEQYKAYVIDLETEKIDEPFMEYRKTYNRFGNIISEEYFNQFGELQQTYKGYYSEDGTYSETILSNVDIEDETVTVNKYDTISGRLKSVESTLNDSIKNGFLLSYDAHGNTKELKSFSKLDSGSLIYQYAYDNNERILSEIQITSYKSDTLNAYTYLYDSSGNKIEQFYKSSSDFIGDSRTVFEYDTKNRLKMTTHYESGMKSQEIVFDTLENEIKIKEYKEGIFDSQTRFEYEYDERGNWIQQEVYRSEKGTEEIPSFVKSRRIEYFK